MISLSRRIFRWFRRYRYYLLAVFTILAVWYWKCLPDPLFKDPSCTVLEDRQGNLLAARISGDGQWRFPLNRQVPEKFRLALLQFEDRRFYDHHGVSTRAIARALYQNTREMEVKSGGSTITMQLVRLMRKKKDRNLYDKIVECILATRIELSYSKKEILALYASHAPFGGNVVGLDAASWRYFGRSAGRLSWAESATLAVLPNAPGLIFPGKNQEQLRAKRNRLLDRLHQAGFMDNTTLDLAKAEPLPQKPYDIPQLATQLMDRAIAEGMAQQVIRSSIDQELQKQVMQTLSFHHARLKANEVNNIAAVVLDIRTNKVLAYVGNTGDFTANKGNGNAVDVIRAPRSTGSILKPFLYAGAMDEGLITPSMLLPDIPTHLSGFSPKNFNMTYDGAVPADQALARSLNIPAVKLLGQYGVEKFHHRLRRMGMHTLNRPASHYGLALILGGAEASLWDISNMYGDMAKVLSSGPHPAFGEASYLEQAPATQGRAAPFSAGTVWNTFEAMEEVLRPEEELNWKYFSASRRIAWKTGTSYGFRDAWSVGVTPRYVVGVWVGNASGEGRPGLTGVGAAAPVLFDIFDKLPNPGPPAQPGLSFGGQSWFAEPAKGRVLVPVCRMSGHRASDLCEATDSSWIPEAALTSPVCPYHQLVHLDATGKWRVDSECEEVHRMKHQSWFVLPPMMEWYYKFRNPAYKALPPYRTDCRKFLQENSMAIVYPKRNSRIYVPVALNGQQSRTIFEVTHRKPSTVIYWHVDDVYIGSTRDIHNMEFQPAPGKHILTLVDENGITVSQEFEVSSEGKEGVGITAVSK